MLVKGAHLLKHEMRQEPVIFLLKLHIWNHNHMSSGQTNEWTELIVPWDIW